MSNSKIMRIDFTHNIGPYKQSMVALFDFRDLTEEEAKKRIKAYPQEHDDQIIFISLQQFETVFRSLQEGHED